MACDDVCNAIIWAPCRNDITMTVTSLSVLIYCDQKCDASTLVNNTEQITWTGFRFGGFEGHLGFTDSFGIHGFICGGVERHLVF